MNQSESITCINLIGLASISQLTMTHKLGAIVKLFFFLQDECCIINQYRSLHIILFFLHVLQVDVEAPDLFEFPKIRDAVYQECILKEGQMLYIPKGCWHYIRSLSVSFSVSFWW